MPRSTAEQERWAFIRHISGMEWNQAVIELGAHDRCAERVSSGDAWTSSHWCARPIKAEGLCGVHLAAKKRKLALEVKRATSEQQDELLGRALSRILDHRIHAFRMYGSYLMFVVEDVDSTLAEFGIEPPRPHRKFKHAKNCPHMAVGPTHIGESCREFVRRAGAATGPDVSDLEEDG